MVTSGIDGIYPSGFVVGRIETIEKSGAAYKSVRVRPAVDFSALEQLLVVLELPAVVYGPLGPTGSTGTPSATEKNQ